MSREGVKQVIQTDFTVPCTCGGEVSGSRAPYSLLHSLPTCAEYDAVETLGEAADFLERVRAALEEKT